MSETDENTGERLDVRHPLVRQLAELTAEITGARLLIVYPNASGWEQVHGDRQTHRQPAFCALVKSATDGAKHCRMCHIMMAVAACGGGPAEQRCHAGASVLVCPAASEGQSSMAVLSSCVFSSEEGWAEARQRGKKLGLDLKKLRAAFTALPRMDDAQLRALASAMQAMGYALQTVRQNQELGQRLARLSSKPDLVAEMEHFLENPEWANLPRLRRRSGGESGNALIRVVRELVRQRPDLPLTVKELAAAARLTPNHFSALFSQETDMPFNEYLTEQRMARAKKLLRNPTLQINEIARRSGYDDPGYFTRRFRDLTKLSPRAWRIRHAGARRGTR